MSRPDPLIFWHVYPLGALGAPIRDWDRPGSDVQPARRLSELAVWVDYAADLGCTALLLGPIFASTSHGYDTVDHYRIDPRLGDEGDFDALIAAADRRGLAVVLDGVFNHVGAQHPLVAAALADPGNAGWIRLDWADGRARAHGWEGHTELVELDHADPRVADLVVDVMVHWLRRGVAGWRLDVAYAVPPRFWAEVLRRVRAQFPDAYFLGEVIHGDYARMLEAATWDSLTQYELWKAIWSSLAERNLWELAWALDRHAAFSAHHVLATFVGNHDVDRIASVVGDSGAALAAVILMTLPGSPSIYYGDEQAFRGRKGTGLDADLALRPPLPGRPADLAPFGWWLHHLYRQLTALRATHRWLSRAHVEVLGKDLTWIEFECTGEGHRLTTRVELVPAARAVVHVDGVAVLTWSAP